MDASGHRDDGMTVTMNDLEQVSQDTFKISWTTTETDPLFYIYKNGKLYRKTYDTEIIVTLDGDESPVYEVFDNATSRPSDFFPDRVKLNWWCTESGVDYFEVAEFVSGAWVVREKIYTNGGVYYDYLSRVLEDCQVHTFRITPYGTNGNAGTEILRSVLMVRYPDVPDASFTYDSGTGKITVTVN